MEAAELVSLIEILDDNVDDLEEAMQPLLCKTMNDTAANLPLMDKAQLYVFIAYAIESVLFCLCCPFSLQKTHVLIHCSLSSSSWRRRQDPSSFQGVDQSQAIS